MLDVLVYQSLVVQRAYKVNHLGWVVRKPVNVNPGLNVN